VPAPLFFISSLRKLDLSQNHLVSISGIGELRELEQLDISQNRLEYLPDEMGQLKKLKELRLAKNRLNARSIPLDLFQNGLVTLDLSENKFKIINSELARAFSNVPVLLLHGNIWEVVELQKIVQNTTQEEIKQLISLYLERVNPIASGVDTINKSEESLKEKKKNMTEQVGGFLARKLSIGRGTAKQDTKPKAENNEQIFQADAIVKQDGKVGKPLVFSRAEGSKQKDVASPVSTLSTLQTDGDNESSPKSVTLPSHGIDSTLKSPQQVAPKLPERTAAPLKQQSRASGPKGRKPPSAEFIAQNIPHELPKINAPVAAVDHDDPNAGTKQKVQSAPATGIMLDTHSSSGNHSKDNSIDSNVSDLPPPQLPPKSTKPVSRSGSQIRRPSTPVGNEIKSTIEPVADNGDREESTKGSAPQLPSKMRKQTDSKQQPPSLIEQQEEPSVPKAPMIKPNGPQFDLAELKSRQQKQQEEPSASMRSSNGSTNEKPKGRADSEVVPPKVPPKKGQENTVKDKAADVSKNPEIILPPRPKRADSNNQLTDSPKPLRPGAPQFDLSELKSKQEKVEETKKGNSPSSSSPAGPFKLEEAQKLKADAPSPNRIGLEQGQNSIHAQLKEQLTRQLSNLQGEETGLPSKLKKSEVDKSQDKLNMPKEVPALPPKVAPRPNLESTNSQKNVMGSKESENSSIPPWKQELERRKQQQQQA
jgi:hypothetical protein